MIKYYPQIEFLLYLFLFIAHAIAKIPKNGLIILTMSTLASPVSMLLGLLACGENVSNNNTCRFCRPFPDPGLCPTLNCVVKLYNF